MPLPTKEDKILLAVDGGGTRTRCAAYTLDGFKLAVAEGGPSNHLSADRLRVLESLQTTLARTLSLCGRQRSDVLVVSAGFAGVDFDGTGASDMQMLLKDAGYAETLIHGDMVTAHAGALEGQPGVLAIAGTGSVFFGISPSGKRLKLGGFGYMFGDEGSGYWIAIQALRAASKAYDQRGEPTSLVELFCEALGVSGFSQLPQLLHYGPMQPAQIAKLSRTVQTAAANGDAIATNILVLAGRELAMGATALIRELDCTTGCAVSYYGAILQTCPVVLETFNKQLELYLPAIKVKAPASDALHGAFLLAKDLITSRR
ncbi:MAG: BadF/BadG/BcrA/BcrD ATPase family protein [Acidobacteriota bacterium]